MQRLALLLVVFAALLATPSQAQDVGTGDLWLHEKVMKFYREFDSDSSAVYLAVSTNGVSAGYSYCPSIGNCRPTAGKAEALRACRAVPIDIPGECFIFASKSGIVWEGEVHVLTHDQWMAHTYGPKTVDAALAAYTRHVAGPLDGVPLAFTPTARLQQRADFRLPAANFSLGGDECRYAFQQVYMTSRARNFFLADPSGTYCAYATGYAQQDEIKAFETATAACTAIAKGKPCLVYATGDQLLPGRKL